MSPAPRKSVFARVSDYFLPHARNDHRPHVFRSRSVIALALGIIALEGAYLAYVHVILPKTNFMASVLPGTLIALTNEDRLANNLGRVSENPLLSKAATLAAEDMAAKGYFAHVSPEGKQPWNWLQQVGYEYQYSGQNLAVNFTDSKDVEEAWMNSPTHRANIVKPQYTEIGIGTAQGTYEGKDVTFVVQFFATPVSKATAPIDSQLVVDPPAPRESLAVSDLAPDTSEGQDDSSARGETQILGSEVSPVAAAAELSDAASQAAASPSHTLYYILGGIAALAILLILLGVLMHARLPYFEVLGGAVVIVFVAVGAIYLNEQQKVEVRVSDTALMTQE